jgi:gamma-glutamyltranspeptidase/glutathione hydrolase
LYGLVQGEQNRIEPGKRPLSSMTPTIVTKDGKTVMVLGTAGGSRIITAVLNTILNVVDYDMDIQEAVDAPRVHQQWLPETTTVEKFALSPDTRAALERMGHRFTESLIARHVTAIYVDAAGKRYLGANDSGQHGGLALGY